MGANGRVERRKARRSEDNNCTEMPKMRSVTGCRRLMKFNAAPTIECCSFSVSSSFTAAEGCVSESKPRVMNAVSGREYCRHCSSLLQCSQCKAHANINSNFPCANLFSLPLERRAAKTDLISVGAVHSSPICECKCSRGCRRKQSHMHCVFGSPIWILAWPITDTVMSD